MARGRYLAAIHVYDQLPTTASVLNKTGVACEHMLMFERARTSFEAALKLDPKYAEAYNNMGTLAHSQGDLGRAEKMYKKALKLKPSAANTMQNLGALYYAQRKYKKGDAEYKRALAIDPGILEHSAHTGIPTTSKAEAASELHYHMAMTYAQAGSRAMALDYLRKAIGEGFSDRNRLLHDKEFADLRTTDVFLKMVDDLKKN
jgi:tetratricopeptide (TPR) repeat protein